MMMNRKKAMYALLMAGISLFCAGCGSSQPAAPAATISAPSQGTSASETTLEEKSEESTDDTTKADVIVAASEGQESESGKTLVVYFSNTGNTRAIAKSIADGLSSDLYEIVPEDPYTDADLDYGNNNSRSTVEMNDDSARPAISGSVENMDQYDTVYIGYPIWHAQAPRILNTFVESYDFTDKTVIPFCTSASSGVGSSAKGLEELSGTGNWLDGKRFSGGESSDVVMEWVNSL